jgi:hypothetical protein
LSLCAFSPMSPSRRPSAAAHPCAGRCASRRGAHHGASPRRRTYVTRNGR